MKQPSDILAEDKYYVNISTKLSKISLRDFELVTIIKKLKEGRYQVKTELGKVLKFSKRRILSDNEIYCWHSDRQIDNG